MDKLKEVQKYQFWILLGVALILPFVGWIMGTSGMVTEAAARTKTLTELDGKLKATSEDPNSDWERRLGEINAEQEKQKLLAWRELYARQAPKMVWLKEMKISDPEEIKPLQMEIFRVKYREALEKVRQIVKPIVDGDAQTGQLVYPEELLPAPDDDWKNQAPSRKEIEAAQEDLWLLEALLTCIESVNRGTPSAYEAPIREITELLLRGGSPKGSGGSSLAKSSSGGAGGGAMPTGGHEGTRGAMMGMPRMGGMSTVDSGGGGIADSKINADEELGAERPASDAKTGDSRLASSSPTGGASSSTGPAAGLGAAGMMPFGMGGLVGGSRGGSNMERYRDDQPEWRTRGFTLQVVMDHRRIPDLLVALSNCDWPINILRVHEADFKDEDLVSADGGGAGSGMPMSGRSGAPFGRGMSGAGMGGAPGMGSVTSMPRGGHSAPKASAPRSTDESGEGSFNPRSANDPMDDPNLANVSIVGVIYIFKKPPPETAAASAAQQTPPAAGQPRQGTAPAAEAKPTDEASEDSEPAKADDEKSDEASDASDETGKGESGNGESGKSN